MRLGEKEPAAVAGAVGHSSTAVQELVNVPEVSSPCSNSALHCALSMRMY